LKNHNHTTCVITTVRTRFSTQL